VRGKGGAGGEAWGLWVRGMEMEMEIGGGSGGPPGGADRSVVLGQINYHTT
jgi:hypothetical protein